MGFYTQFHKWICRVVVVTMVLVMGVTSAHAEIIRAIDVVGNHSVSADTILATIQSRAGQPFNADRISHDVKALFALGQFMDVRIEDVGGVMRIVLRERPVIRNIKFQGNTHIKSHTLQEDLKIKPFQPLDGKELAITMQKIRERYAKKGYYTVETDYQLVATPNPGEMDLIITIKENEKAAVRKISFIGNHVFSDSQLRKIIRTKEKSPISFMTGSGKFKEQQLEQDVMLITYNYLNKGYLKIKVDNPRTDISKDMRTIYINYLIEEGHQYRIANIRVEGDILTTPDQIIDMVTIKPKQIYNQSVVEGDVASITNLYSDEGYAFVNIQPIPETHDDDTADIVFKIDKGPRVKVGKINISGNTITRDKVIRREMRVKEGDIFNQRLLELSKQKLQQLGFFSEINIATPRGNQDDVLNINITVKEKPTGSFNFGAGFSTGENLILQGSISKNNFFGYGISGNLSAEYSSLRQQFSLSASDPYFLDTDWMLGVNGYKSAFKFVDFNRDSLGAGLNIGRRLFTNASVNIGYQYEKIKVTDFSFAVPSVFTANASGVTSEVTMTISYDTRDNRVFPNKGVFITSTGEISGAKLGGTVDFARVNASARYYQPIYKGISSKNYFRIGYIKSLNSQIVPLYERYFLGGPNTLRGYYPRTVGPTVQIPSGPAGPVGVFNYGGDKMIQANFEIELPIYNPAGFKAVAFFDAGNAYAEDQSISMRHLKLDYGFGFRWLSPMGPLRFEWGMPINKQPGEDPVVFNFTIGDLF
ncbi:MAG: outer membrane protein assembly factor BamA [Deltaproteobacteria bacterium CG11_big_fil_rev_8_21_14_0_20_47_16]|nr:MAG: outer membrane protein assembly factor BamA [Deltaproteobacteria bacterium CG11_big_fil_rev_8_21_14_0_20_47_16]